MERQIINVTCFYPLFNCLWPRERHSEHVHVLKVPWVYLANCFFPSVLREQTRQFHTHITHWLLLKMWWGHLRWYITPFSTVYEISRLWGPWAGQQCVKGAEATWPGHLLERVQGGKDHTSEGRPEVPESRMQQIHVATLLETSFLHNPCDWDSF